MRAGEENFYHLKLCLIRVGDEGARTERAWLNGQREESKEFAVRVGKKNDPFAEARKTMKDELPVTFLSNINQGRVTIILLISFVY
jgi:hypothetical protein